MIHERHQRLQIQTGVVYESTGDAREHLLQARHVVASLRRVAHLNEQ